MREQHSSRVDDGTAGRPLAGVTVHPPSDPNALGATPAPAAATVLPQGAPLLTASGRRPVRVRPVFVDRTGRRRRLTVLAGFAVGAGLLVSLGLLTLGLLAGGPVTVPGWPDIRGEQAPEEAGVGRLSVDDSPSATPPDGSGRTGSPVDGSARPPVATSRPAPPPTPGPTTTDRPGQGDLHRNPKAVQSTTDPDKPGKPRRSSGAPG
ncbi:hypothetical protein ACFP2T_26675 [Plantactinospora solaniradicis]|uniref:Serine/threonine protein kinase n=1 Tax=Plantactinospora solaniradicis TaxID=1723736 RepID=A0ABW1KDB8_9ACTN